jgi:hypothetical protein
MGDSKRQKIVSAVVTRLKLINGSGGYTTNVANRVEDSRTNWQQEELPAISVFDGDAEGTPTSTGQTLGTIHAMPLIIRGFLEQGSTAAAARTLLKDIQRAIRVDDKWTVSNVKLVMQTRQVTDRILRNEESFEVEAAEQVIEVQFQTAKFDAES